MAVEKTHPINIGAATRDKVLETASLIEAKMGFKPTQRDIAEIALNEYHAKWVAQASAAVSNQGTGLVNG